MAEGSKFSKSVLNASEEIYNYNCSSCLDEGRYNEALKYCVSCKLYYCKKCLGDHNKFPALKAHRVQDVASMKKHIQPPADTKMTAEPLTEPCEHHPDEIVKMYCSEHEVVCCTVCIALDHRDCKDVDYIPKVAKGFRTSQPYTSFLEYMRRMKEELQETKLNILDELQKLSDLKEDVIEQIKRYKNELIEQISDLEAKSINRVNESYKLVAENLKAKAFNINECLDEVMNSLQESGNESEAMLFVRMKTVHRKEIDDIKSDNCSFEGLSFSFSLNKHVQSVLIDSDGLVKQNVPCKVTVTKKYDVSFESDKCSSSVSDICLLNDGTVVLADFDSLKRLDESFHKLQKLDLTGQPFGICETSRHNELAVTLREAQVVQFVSHTKNAIVLKNKFRVGAPCKGICLVDRNFFITCGGGDEDNVSGHVRRFDIAGTLLDTVEFDDGVFTSPRHLTLSVDRTEVYVADKDNGVIVLDKFGKKLGQFKHKGLRGAYAVITSVYGNFVVGSESNNVQQFDENFRYIGTILNNNDGLNNPLTLRFTEKGDQMVLSMDDNDSIFFVQLSDIEGL